MSCLDPNAQWYAGTPPLAPTRFAITTTPSPIPVILRDSALAYLFLSQAGHFEARARRDWKVSTDEYIYTVGWSEGNAREAAFAWHWHPSVRAECHFHVEARLSAEFTLEKKHIPTARVSVEEVFRFLIQDLDVSPARSDWDEVLRENRARHETHRTWGGSAKPDPEAS